MAINRQDKALREFKQIMQDLVHLLRASTKTELAYLCWVNKSRGQFVWETNSTSLPNVMFKDRINFEYHYLEPYKDSQEIVRLVVGDDISKAKLIHYFDYVQAKNILIIPFVNKGETVALTVLESESELDQDVIYDRIKAYNNALVNVLDTYLEVVDLHEQQQEWDDYEQSLSMLNYKNHRAEILDIMLNEMQKLLPVGSVDLICQGQEYWHVVHHAHHSVKPLKTGLRLEQKSLAFEALDKGENVFTMHFNQNPRRASSKEKFTDGASFAVPIKVFDSRIGVVICTDPDPLSFKESTQHKISNLARVAGLNIQSMFKKTEMPPNPIMTEKYGAYQTELWEKCLEYHIQALYNGEADAGGWFGFITLADVSGLRTKYRLEELDLIQKDLIRAIDPSNYGFNGLIGFNADYVYAFIMHEPDIEMVQDWIEKVNDDLAYGIKLSNGKRLDSLQIKVGFTGMHGSERGVYELKERAKKALNDAVKNESEALIKA